MAELISSVQGATVQEVAAPVADNDSDMDIEDTNELDDPYEFDDDADYDGDDGAETEPVSTEPLKAATQEPDRNAIYADMRRKAEAEARAKATAEAQKLAQTAIDQAFADMGLKDPYTGKMITTKAEYDAYKLRHNSETVSKELGKAGITPEAINAIIDSHPAVLQAKKAVSELEAAQHQAQENSARVRLDEQIKKISALDPSIKTAADLAAQPNYEDIRGYVRKGLSIEEAFKLANMDKLTSKQTAAATQTAINKVASKEHLTSSAARGQGGVVVPKGVMQQYRAINPDMTEKQIRDDYAKHQKKYSK